MNRKRQVFLEIQRAIHDICLGFAVVSAENCRNFSSIERTGEFILDECKNVFWEEGEEEIISEKLDEGKKNILSEILPVLELAENKDRIESEKLRVQVEEHNKTCERCINEIEHEWDDLVFDEE